MTSRHGLNGPSVAIYSPLDTSGGEFFTDEDC